MKTSQSKLCCINTQHKVKELQTTTPHTKTTGHSELHLRISFRKQPLWVSKVKKIEAFSLLKGKSFIKLLGIVDFLSHRDFRNFLALFHLENGFSRNLLNIVFFEQLKTIAKFLKFALFKFSYLQRPSHYLAIQFPDEILKNRSLWATGRKPQARKPLYSHPSCVDAWMQACALRNLCNKLIELEEVSFTRLKKNVTQRRICNI